MTIARDTLIEELVDVVPGAVSYLMGKGIQPIACGAPVWGTIEEAARREGYEDREIDGIVAELRRLQQDD